MAGTKLPQRRDEELSFWERLQKASEWAGIPCTPSDISEELGITPSAVTKYVNGAFPTKKNINALAIKRRVRSEWLLSGQGDMVSERDLEPEALELLHLFRSLSDDAKTRLLASARYEQQVYNIVNTGKRNQLTEELIRLLQEREQHNQ
jgi:predicted transcriptional regulator